MAVDLSRMNSRELLSLYADVLEALRSGGCVRSANNPVADYAELLVARAFDLAVETKSNKGFDALEPITRERYEVKARRIATHSKPTRFSPCRDFGQHHFDYLVALLFEEDFSVSRAIRLSWEQVERISKYNAHLNGNVVFINDALWRGEGHEDVTERLQAAQEAL
jgi:hypothetical protein